MSSVGTVGKMEDSASTSHKTCNESHLDTACPPMSSKNKTEQEGFEPSVPFGTMVFKTTAISHSATAPEAHFVQASLRFYSNLHWDQGIFPGDATFFKKLQTSAPCKHLVF